MRIGWLADTSNMKGGAELTQEEFRAAVPPDIEIVDCPPGEVDVTCDRFVVQNCVTYFLPDFLPLEGKPTVKYWHDVGPWVQQGVRGWLDANATSIYCSPLQYEYMARLGGAGLGTASLGSAGGDAICIPPPIDLRRFVEAADRVNGQRRGSVSVASWRNHGKAPHRVAEWAAEHGPVRFFGDGVFAPPGSQGVPYQQMPELLASFERFVFLPNVVEPFGRLVAEAWAAGCELIVNGNIGATYWIQESPEAIETAGEDFWNVVLEGATRS
jgi:hypothetical protein